MAITTFDRVAETSTTTGTGTYTLAGAKTGYQSFSVVGNGNTTYYCATDGTNWEVGSGVYTSSGTTLSRASILASSNAGAAVNWAAGTRDIFLPNPAALINAAFTPQYVTLATDTFLTNERVLTAGTGITLTDAGAGSTVTVGCGKWVKLATATASGSASVEFTGLSSAYVAYKVMLSHVAPATNSVKLLVRTSTNGGSSYDSGASDYAWTQGGWSGAGGVAYSDGDMADTAFSIHGGSNNVGNASNKYVSGEFTIFNPSAAKYGQMIFVGTSVIGASVTYNNISACGWRLAAADIDAIQFLFSSGNIASGQFDLYGLSA